MEERVDCPTKKLLLVKYVDAFKLAGPTATPSRRDGIISSVIDMDLPEAIGWYFGCMRKEEDSLMLPNDVHPFRHVFEPEQKPAASHSSKNRGLVEHRS